MTARTDLWTDLVAEIADALVQIGVEAALDAGALVVDGVTLVPQVIERAHPTPADLRDLVDEGRGSGAAMVLADRISDAGRAVLRSAGWGWLDRRGHLRVWAPGVRVESPLPGRDSPARRSTSNPWTTVGLEVALAVLLDPDQPVTARRLAPGIGRSVSAVHERIARFVEVGLVGPRTNRPLLPDLFWETSAHWPDDGWVPLSATIQELAERVGGDELVRVDERAATLGGARIAAAAELPPRCYVRSPAAFRKARSMSDGGDRARCWVREAPVEWLPLNEEHPADGDHPWAIAHPMLCALRLAMDPARGREVVEGWGILPGDDV